MWRVALSLGTVRSRHIKVILVLYAATQSVSLLRQVQAFLLVTKTLPVGKRVRIAGIVYI